MFENVTNVITELDRESRALVTDSFAGCELDKVQSSSGQPPTRASCKNIRDDRGDGRRIESYISEHSNTEFSHGLCLPSASELHAVLDPLPPAAAKSVF